MAQWQAYRARRLRFFPWKAICIYATTLQFAFAASGEPDPFELSPEQLFSATVTSATRSSEKLWDAPAAIYVLTSEDIKRSGATAIPEVLRLVPGVQVARTHAGGWAVSVRGFNAELANKLLVLIDGREVYDPLFSGVYWDVQDTMLQDIDRIEVIRGPGASLWGANAVNGVINIITKNAADTQGGLTDITVGSADRAIVGQRYGGTFGENGHYRAYAKYLNRDENRTLTGTGAQDEQIARRGGFRTDWDAGDTGNFTVQGDIYESRSGQLRTVPNFVGPSFSDVVEEKIDGRGGNLLGRWNKTLSSGTKMTVQSYLDYTARDQQLLDDTRTSWDLDGQFELPQQGRHGLIVGGRYRYSYSDLDETSNILTTTNASRNDQLLSAFVQDKITLVPDDWYLTLGSKFEHNDYTGFEIQPNARLQWHPDAQQMVWASVSRAVRTPSRLEENIQAIQAVGGGGAISLDTLPNADLNSEELIAYELGYRRQLTPEASLDLATFYNDYDQLITYMVGGVIAGTNPPRLVIALVPQNVSKAELYGGEAALDWQLRPNLKLSGSYSMLKMVVHEPTGLTPSDIEGQSPQQQFNLRAQWDVTDNVTFDSMLYYVDSLPDFGIDHYWRLDTRLGWQIADGLEFNLVGQNLLDNTHAEFGDPASVSSVEMERAVYGQFLWRF